MISLDQLEAFIAAAEKGSFSAAARHLGKVQSTISNAVINLELETNLQLFDRSQRSPTLTPAGRALIDDAKNVIKSHYEFVAHASSLTSQSETHLCLAIEQSTWNTALESILEEFEQKYPYITLELLDPGAGDVAELVREGRANIGLMIAQDIAPAGINYQGIGHSTLQAVCAPEHPLTKLQPVKESHLRHYRQLITHSRSQSETVYERRKQSARVWLLESPHVTVDLVVKGLGWSLLSQVVIAEKLSKGELVCLELSFEKAHILQGVDVVWSQTQHLDAAGNWMLEQLQDLVMATIEGR